MTELLEPPTVDETSVPGPRRGDQYDLIDAIPLALVLVDNSDAITHANGAARKATAASNLVRNTGRIIGADVGAVLGQTPDLGLSTFDSEQGLIRVRRTPVDGGSMITWEDVSLLRNVENERDEAVSDTQATSTVLRRVSQSQDEESAVRDALDVVREQFGWEYGSFWRVDRSDDALKFVQESGYAGEEFRQVTLTASFEKGVGLSGRAWALNDLYFTPDLGEMTDCCRAPAAQRVGVKSGVVFPIRINGEVIGTMDFFSTKTLTPTPQRLDSLRTVGELVSSALDRLRRETRQMEAAQDVDAVNDVLARLASAPDEETAISEALDAVRARFGWAYGSFWRISDEDNTLRFVQESGDAGEEFRQVTLKASFAKGVGLSGRAWKSGDLFFTPDLGEMTDCVRAPAAQRVGVKSGVVFPIRINGEIIGTMDFFATETLSPSEQRLEALRNVGKLVSQALERVVAQDEERRLAAENQRKVEVVLEVVSAAVAGDLTRELNLDGDGAVDQLAGGLAQLLTTLRHSMGEIGTTADTLAVAAEQLTILSQGMGEGATTTSDRAANSSHAATEVSASIQTVASAAEEMTASIREISQNASEAATVAGSAVSVASSAQQTVASLGQSSLEIGQVVKVITSIAQQTNLLALNATI